MRPVRCTLALLPVLAVVTATAGHAAPTTVPQLKDATGDAATGAAQDVVSVLYTTTGSGTGAAYVPKKLVVTLTMAADVSQEPVFTYEVEAATDTCGDVAFTYEPGTPYETVTGLSGWADFGDCPVADDNPTQLLAPTVKGRTITWTFGISKGSPLKAGAVFTDFRARVDPSNPAVPFPSSVTGTELGLVDAGTGTGSWTLG